MKTLIKYKKYIIILLAIILPLGYFWQRGQIDYEDTTWLTLKGYKSKGYEPYIKVAYGSEGEECKEFIWGLGDFLAQNIKRYYKADISEDDLHYSIRYPMNFTRGGCTFWVVKVYIMLQEYHDLDEKEYPKKTVSRALKIYDSTIGGYSIKYHKPNKQYRLNRVEANPLEINNYCQRSVFDGGDHVTGTQWLKVIECHPEGYSGKRSYFFFEPFVLEHPTFVVNLVMDDIIYADADDKQAKNLGLKKYDERFESTKKHFQMFKEKYNIKEP